MKTISDLGEFGLIERIRRRAGGRAPGVVVGIGDDGAVLRARAGEDVVVSTDALVEGVHFRWGAETAAVLGRRILAVNLSDLAAMGARPLGAVVALAAPPTLPVARVDGVMRGLLSASEQFACPLVGGNLARARETSWTVTVLGGVARGAALRRGRARAGDLLFVTGTLGRATLGRVRREQGGPVVRRAPEPRIRAGRALSRAGGRISCIDVSDGLVSDLGRLLEGTGCGAELDAEALPRPPRFAADCAALGLNPASVLASGGEDYELLFTLAPQAAARSGPGWARRLGVPVQQIGRVTARRGIRGLAAGGGFSHF